jgi:cytochrome c5
MRFITITCLVATLLACGTGPDDEAAPSDRAPATTTTAELTPEVMRRWTQSCALCHVNGEGGAPRVGHDEEWQPRLAQGQDLLLRHTIEGFNNMPPLGYCMACERADYTAMIAFMTKTR